MVEIVLKGQEASEYLQWKFGIPNTDNIKLPVENIMDVTIPKAQVDRTLADDVKAGQPKVEIQNKELSSVFGAKVGTIPHPKELLENKEKVIVIEELDECTHIEHTYTTTPTELVSVPPSNKKNSPWTKLIIDAIEYCLGMPDKNGKIAPDCHQKYSELRTKVPLYVTDAALRSKLNRSYGIGVVNDRFVKLNKNKA